MNRASNAVVVFWRCSLLAVYVCMYVCMVRLFVVSCIRSIKDRSRVLTPKLTVVDQRGLITNT